MNEDSLSKLLRANWRKIVIDRLRTTILSLPTKPRQNAPEHYLDFVDPNKSTIVLLQGFGTTWRTISKLGDVISKQGYPVHIIKGLGHNTARVEQATEMVANYLKTNNLNSVIFVAHSKGGIIGKYVMAYSGAKDLVRGMVAISTPFNGTKFAQLLKLNATQEMDIDSPIIANLEQAKEINKKIISIYPKNDEHIWAANGCFLENAKENIIYGDFGHSHLLFSKKGHALVLSCLAKF